MFKIKILKTASVATVHQLSALMKQLSDKEVEKKTLIKCLKNPQTTVFVATDQAKAIGTLTVSFNQTLTGLRAQIDHVIVDEAYRGRGLGILLTETALAFARKKKARKVFLTSRPDRVAANALYQKLGFKKKETNVYEFKL